MCQFVCLPIVYRCKWRPEEGARLLQQLELQVVVNQRTWVLGTKLRFFYRTASALNG